MRLSCRLVLFCISIGLLTACSTPAPPGDDFSFRPDPLRIYHVTLILQSEDSAVSDKGIGIAWRWREKIGMQLRLLEQKDSLYHLAMTYTGYSRTPWKAIVPIEDDTAFSREIPTPETMKRNIGEEIRYWFLLATGVPQDVWINRKGVVVKVDGYSRLVDSVVARSGANRREVYNVLKEELQETATQDYLNQVFSFVPGRHIDSGKSWVVDDTLVNQAPVIQSNVYVLKQRIGDTAVLDVTSYVSARRSVGGLPYAKGRRTGILKASYSTGMPYGLFSQGAMTRQTEKDTFGIPSRKTVYVALR
ncbi:MAG: hypothetical protein JST39_00315 [Bacteroidetes bacterium]|nr:hypothetical protein [Bacteroidota bacterium]